MGLGNLLRLKVLQIFLNYEGEILICGHPNNTIEAKKCFSYVPEIPMLYDVLTVDETIEFIGRAYRVKNYKEIADKYLEAFKMTENRKKLAKELSKGMRQKLSMILAFMIEPKALLVDEPMVGLDPASIEEVLELFRQLRAEGTAILISTHIIDIVNDIWDRAYIMNRGEIVKEIDRKDAGEETLKEIFFETTREGDV